MRASTAVPRATAAVAQLEASARVPPWFRSVHVARPACEPIRMGAPSVGLMRTLVAIRSNRLVPQATVNIGDTMDCSPPVHTSSATATPPYRAVHHGCAIRPVVVPPTAAAARWRHAAPAALHPASRPALLRHRTAQL
jgi:hypothetical protein